MSHETAASLRSAAMTWLRCQGAGAVRPKARNGILHGMGAMTIDDVQDLLLSVTHVVMHGAGVHRAAQGCAGVCRGAQGKTRHIHSF